MPTYRFIQVDVFTDRPFGGNPLAVFPDAQGLSDAEMLQLARELNLSETTFVLPPTRPGADFKVRIFMPTQEIPFAGHPLVGTHWALAHLGRVRLQEPTTCVTFELGVGLRSAVLHVAEGRVTRVVTDHQRPEFLAVADARQVQRLAQGLGLPAAAITATGTPVQVVSTGFPQLFVPVRSLAEVSSLHPFRLDVPALAEVCGELGLPAVDVAVFTQETALPGRHVHLRFFAPTSGVPEDPATGSASGGLGAYLVRYGLVPAGRPVAEIHTEQGLEMGRPSHVVVEVEGPADDIRMVRVSGSAVKVLEGVATW
ncbi:MAG: PhzF family phenazine biosynthesis protein [Anaerolineae bacterium]|nr:PhzF family phenazine biosynthesis protein [Anaerolineae bacterium]